MKWVWHIHTSSRLPGVRTRPRWEASLLLCNRAKLTCGLICVHGKRERQICAKRLGKYISEANTKYFSIVWSELIKPDARPSQRTISWLHFVFLHWLLGPWTAFFSDCRCPWFPCGSKGGPHGYLRHPAFKSPAVECSHSKWYFSTKAIKHTQTHTPLIYKVIKDSIGI